MATPSYHWPIGPLGLILIILRLEWEYTSNPFKTNTNYLTLTYLLIYNKKKRVRSNLMGHFYCLLCKNFTGHEGSFYFNDNKLWVNWDCIEISIIRIIIILLAAKNDIYWLCVLHIFLLFIEWKNQGWTEIVDWLIFCVVYPINALCMSL